MAVPAPGSMVAAVLEEEVAKLCRLAGLTGLHACMHGGGMGLDRKGGALLCAARTLVSCLLLLPLDSGSAAPLPVTASTATRGATSRKYWGLTGQIPLAICSSAALVVATLISKKSNPPPLGLAANYYNNIQE